MRSTTDITNRPWGRACLWLNRHVIPGGWYRRRYNVRRRIWFYFATRAWWYCDARDGEEMEARA